MRSASYPLTHATESSEGGMIRLETLIELKFLNSSFSNCFLLSELDNELSVERFEPTVSHSAVSSPLLHLFKIYQRGLQWKQDVVVFMMCYILVYHIVLPPSTAPPSHCTPPVMNTYRRSVR